MTTTYNLFDAATGLTLESSQVASGLLSTASPNLVSRTTGSFAPGSSAISMALANLAKKPGDTQAWLQVSADGSTWTNLSGDDVSNAGGYSFDGVDDNITVPNHANLYPGSGAFTVAFWAKVPAANTGRMLLGIRDSSGNVTQWDFFGTASSSAPSASNPGKKLCFIIRESGSKDWRKTTNDDVFDGKWHHFAAVSNGSNSIMLYVDGLAVAQTATNIGTWPTVSPTSTLAIGGPAGFWANCSLDDVRIYKGTAFTAAEMLDLAKRRHSAHATTAWWKLDGNANDSSGNGHNGTINGATSITDFTLLPSFGERLVSEATVSPLAASFDGVNDSLSRAYHAAFHSASTLSVSAWICSKSTAATKQDICSRFQSIAHRGWLLAITPSTGKLHVELSSDGGYTNYKNYVSSVTGLSDGKWHHVAFTWNAGTLKLYIDGVEDTTPTKTTDAAITTIYNPAANAIFQIGNSADNTRFFSGNIANVALWNDVRSGAEIAASHAAGYEDHANANVIGYWPCGYAGSLLTDLGPNGFTLTASGPTSFESWNRPLPTLVEQSLDVSGLGLTSVMHWRILLESALTSRTAAVDSLGIDFTAAATGSLLKMTQAYFSRMAA